MVTRTPTADKPVAVRGLSLPARNALLSVTNPAKYHADRRRGMGETDAEVTYIARLKGAMGHAKRNGDAMWEGRRRTYRQLRNLFRKYQAAKAAAAQPAL